MRLIPTKGSDEAGWIPQLCTRRGHESYAILSHRWHNDSNSEILFADIDEIDQSVIGAIRNSQCTAADPRKKSAFPKVQGAASRALADGHDYIWIDTCCIDKTSSAELSEAINSMFAWYRASEICYVYLTDCESHSPQSEIARTRFASSQWWQRGWTLQKLIAPHDVIFFSSDWAEIGRKCDPHIATEISEITRIDVNVLNGTIPLNTVSVAQRMSWAAARTTSRIEDIAYSLMGIFSVNMPLLYGEGERAFLRLQHDIMKESNDQTIFAWICGRVPAQSALVSPDVLSGLLATHPSAFSASQNIIQYHNVDHGLPFTMTNNGLSICLRLEDVGDGLFVARLYCIDSEINAEVGIYLRRITTTGEQYTRVHVSEWASISRQAHFGLVSLHVKQYHDQIPAYQELDREQRKIRLLQILSTDDASDMKLRLLKANVAVARYTALSYVWGPSDQMHEIWANSERVQIPEKALTVLQKARSRSTRDLFWIDTICLQQVNALEKAAQVMLMSEIYRHASYVMVLLDNIDPSIIDRFTGVSPSSLDLEHTEIMQASHIDTVPTWNKLLEVTRAASIDGKRTSIDAIDDHLTNNIATIEAIARHRYWTRLWVLQEFVPARDIILQFDTSSLSLPTFMRTYVACIAMMKKRGLYNSIVFRYINPFLHFAETKKQVETEIKGSHYKKSFMLEPLGNKFEDLLEAFRFHECTNPFDRIYALLQCSDLGLDLHIDYSRSQKELLLEVITARGGSLTHNALGILQQALSTVLSEEEIPLHLLGQHSAWLWRDQRVFMVPENVYPPPLGRCMFGGLSTDLSACAI